MHLDTARTWGPLPDRSRAPVCGNPAGDGDDVVSRILAISRSRFHFVTPRKQSVVRTGQNNRAALSASDAEVTGGFRLLSELQLSQTESSHGPDKRPPRHWQPRRDLSCKRLAPAIAWPLRTTGTITRGFDSYKRSRATYITRDDGHSRKSSELPSEYQRKRQTHQTMM